MLTIVIKKDYYAYFDCEDNSKLFPLLLKSFTRKERKYNNYYKIWENKFIKLYSLINNGKTLRVKAGLVPYLCNSLDKNNIKYEIIDERKNIIDNFELFYKLNDEVLLRPYQIEAVDNIIRDRFCYVQIPTAGGKTEVSASIIKSFLNHYGNEAVLYLVPTIKLQEEASDRFRTYNIPVNNKLPIVKGEANVLTYTAIIRATSSKFDYLQRDSIGMFIVDEAHHLSANKLSKVVHSLHNLRFSIGLSATPSNNLEKKKYLKELNSKEMLVFGCTGICSYRMEIKDTIKNNFVTQIEIRVLSNTPKNIINEDVNDWNLIRNLILKDKDRADRVAKYTKHIVDNANLNTVILLTPEIKMSNIYMESIHNEFANEKDICIFELYGGNRAVEHRSNSTIEYNKKEDIDLVYKKIKDPNIKTICSVTSFFFEGIDIKNIQAIINCYGGRDLKRVKQQAGRCMRLFEGKNIAYIHEIQDVGNPVLESQFNKRIKIYTEEYNAKVIYSEF